MKHVLIALVLGLTSTAFADVCQIKPNIDKSASPINYYALKIGKDKVAESSFYEDDFKFLVSQRDNLIKIGYCTAEPVLEECSITTIEKSNSITLRIGNTAVADYKSYYVVEGKRILDTHALVTVLNTVQMLKDAQVCK